MPRMMEGFNMMDMMPKMMMGMMKGMNISKMIPQMMSEMTCGKTSNEKVGKKGESLFMPVMKT